MTENKRFTVDGLTITENSQKGRKYLLEYQGGVNALCNRINGLFDKSKRLEKENKELKASLYAEKTNTAEVVNDYAKQFKRHSAQFSFMIDLAEDLGVDVRKLEALDD